MTFPASLWIGYTVSEMFNSQPSLVLRTVS
jgi:hypothetical protein